MSCIFDPNAAAASDSGIFGLPFSYEEASLVYLPVPWEATTSYGGGTSEGPTAILEASRQVDLFDADVLRPYEARLHLLPESEEVRAKGKAAKAQAARIIATGGRIEGHPELEAALAEVNSACAWMNSYVHKEISRLLEAGKIPALIGGDHSTPFGAIQAVAERQSDLGILHIDAHSDTRRAYEGFTWSHASIMFNVLDRIPGVHRLVQVGIRDFCEQEWDFCQSQKDRVRVFWDAQMCRRKLEGRSWASLADEIVAALPRNIWVSFDIDGLDARFCPHTGTPVPGGLEFAEANYLLRAAVKAGRTLVGFDLNEVAPDPEGADEWDANVGARMLYKLTGWTLASQGRARVLEL
ncbi:MAG TPA: agmatinase family protein [Candidatus Paceibacterota bacterium]|nr:agmatinase family protein [Candidatus Paceibacterota bacterium]